MDHMNRSVNLSSVFFLFFVLLVKSLASHTEGRNNNRPGFRRQSYHMADGHSPDTSRPTSTSITSPEQEEGQAEGYGIEDQESYTGQEEGPGTSHGESRYETINSGSRETHSNTANNYLNLQSSTCPTCSIRLERAKLIRIETVKRNILENLHMTSPPNVSVSNNMIPKNAELRKFINLYANPGETDNHGDDRQNDQGWMEPKSRIEKMILFPKRPSTDWDFNDNTSFAFAFSEKLFSYDVTDASLHVYVRAGRPRRRSSVYYAVLRRVYTPPTGSNVPKIKTETEKKIRLNPRRGEWLVLNMTNVAQDWIDYPADGNNLIQLSIVDDSGTEHDTFLDTNVDSDYEKRPFLMLSMKKKHSQRKRRNADQYMCNADTRVTSCCKYAMTIDFESIGWDWILAPRRYEANLCQGECPRYYLLEYAYTQIYEAIAPSGDGTRGACCAPDIMNDVNLLHIDKEGNIQLSLISSMTVETCQCA